MSCFNLVFWIRETTSGGSRKLALKRSELMCDIKLVVLQGCLCLRFRMNLHPIVAAYCMDHRVLEKTSQFTTGCIAELMSFYAHEVPTFIFWVYWPTSIYVLLLTILRNFLFSLSRCHITLANFSIFRIFYGYSDICQIFGIFQIFVYFSNLRIFF